MGADAEADEGLLVQAKDNDKISGYLGRWKASLPLSTDGTAAEIKNAPGTYRQVIPGARILLLEKDRA